LIIHGGFSGDVFNSSIEHAHALCSSRRTGARLSILLLCMKNHAVVTIEGRRGSVKGKGKLRAVELDIANTNVDIEPPENFVEYGS
jgi:hypothetical protein